jgi:hypothetical protein
MCRAIEVGSVPAGGVGFNAVAEVARDSHRGDRHAAHPVGRHRQNALARNAGQLAGDLAGGRRVVRGLLVVTAATDSGTLSDMLI